MLTQEENDLLTRVGPGTPGGDLLRRYWQPVALATELPAGGPPLPTRLFGEDLVLFRVQSSELKVQSEGRSLSTQHAALSTEIGLLGLHCSHRGADLSYGRLEDGGLRCIYHGWLYDIHGRCLEQPGEPAFRWTDSGGRVSAASSGLEPQTQGSAFKEKIRHKAYPCLETGGVIFAYLGPGSPPLFPDFELFRVPSEHRWMHKYFHECNYLQGLEGNLDPTHPFFLHRFLPGSQLLRSRVPIDGSRATPAYDTSVHAPDVRAEEAPFGVRIYGLYHANSEERDIRTSGFVMPNTCAVSGGPVPPGDGYLMSWHVPIDDEHHWRYYIAFKRSGPLDPRHAQERASVTTPDFHFIRTKANRYLQDRQEQRTETFSGMGPIFVAHDSCVTETAGAIQDRTQEHLGTTDAGIVLARRMLLRAIRDVQDGRDPAFVFRRPEDNDQLQGMGVTEERIPASRETPQSGESPVGKGAGGWDRSA